MPPSSTPSPSPSSSPTPTETPATPRGGTSSAATTARHRGRETSIIDFLFDFAPSSTEIFRDLDSYLLEQEGAGEDDVNTTGSLSPSGSVGDMEDAAEGVRSDLVDFDQMGLMSDDVDVSVLSGAKEIWQRLEKSLKRKRGQLDDAMQKLASKRTDLSAELRKNVDGIVHRVKKQQDRLEGKKKQLLRQISRPAFVRKKDKFAFTFGVTLTIVTAIILAGYSAWLPWHYMFFSIVLLTVRYFIYHKNAEHYFMIDFCYFSNFLMLFYLFMYPTSPQLFLLNFSNSNGPLMSAIVAWRNSLVFHDLDKITSSFIHTLPFLVSYVVRWKLTYQYAVCKDEMCTVSLSEIVVSHLGFFLFWQITYYLKTEIVDKEKLAKRSDIVTSFRYMTTVYRGSKADRLLSIFGAQGRIFMFMFLQMIYHLITVIPTLFMFRYQWVHVTCIILIMLKCIHNGSNYYIEKFSSRYLKQLEVLAMQFEAQESTEILEQLQDKPSQAKELKKDIDHSSNRPPAPLC